MELLLSIRNALLSILAAMGCVSLLAFAKTSYDIATAEALTIQIPQVALAKLDSIIYVGPPYFMSPPQIDVAPFAPWGVDPKWQTTTLSLPVSCASFAFELGRQPQIHGNAELIPVRVVVLGWTLDANGRKAAMREAGQCIESAIKLSVHASKNLHAQAKGIV
ncbi:thiamine-monophosphate kinase [Novimethylophilus kurashikiensis]|uniref:Thiamine-monophosphate kinase n=1 Tax=Novimethylophilus kurashikiensis TaxID=1825523 RepID=A0A2R5FEP2_9PROT|nr:hypothetical protein [Novimethylophilus kurashikiensis]GBG14894.1 thiamine-monophosphate kinase [Novimethylophilus kurashikiensis]